MISRISSFAKRSIVVAAALSASAIGFAAETSTAATLPANTEIALSTVQDLTSKKAHKGDQVALVVTEDVMADGAVVIRKGTLAVGRIAFAQDTGAFGQSGKLKIEPLYIQLNGTTIRLQGSVFKKGTVTAGAAAGLIVLTPGMTGRSAKIPAGTAIPAATLRDVKLPTVPIQPPAE
ncbi:hypothetical protein DXH95_02060 [Sphingorhabdus pulchriflava]|uniref:FecR protein domain-containing protein n=1 Tax=Sphingorhabdus pulchriflava TaxID=2292257 RepID=A0A371BF91_9SPHN|nr:hypothetical protein DXH95_02060 [Sphingorhabdus pulchriflava]